MWSVASEVFDQHMDHSVGMKNILYELMDAINTQIRHHLSVIESIERSDWLPSPELWIRQSYNSSENVISEILQDFTVGSS